MPVAGLGAGDLAHGVVEGQAEDLDEEVNGVAGLVVLGPAPVAVFEEQARIGGQFEVVGRATEQYEAALLQEGRQRGHAGGPDLFMGPARRARVSRWVGHRLSSSGVGSARG